MVRALIILMKQVAIGGNEENDDVFGTSTKTKEISLDQDDVFNGSDDEGGGWDDDVDIRADIDAEISNVAAKETAGFVAPESGLPETALWVKTSPLAADHIAAGSFETAMQVKYIHSFVSAQKKI